MTELQKMQIRTMRMQGIGYHVIAKELCLKENQVQLFCKAHGLAGDSNLVRLNYPIWCQQNNRCPVCGAECETIYQDVDGDIFGCDECVATKDACPAPHGAGGLKLYTA